MPYQDDDLKWLENERRGKQNPAPSVSTVDPDLEWLEKERQAGASTPTPTPSPSPTPEPTPLPRPRSTTPAYIPVTERQEFKYRRPLNLDTALDRSQRANVGKVLSDEARMRMPIKLPPDWRTTGNFEDANQRISDIVADPAKMAALPPEQQQLLQG